MFNRSTSVLFAQMLLMFMCLVRLQAMEPLNIEDMCVTAADKANNQKLLKNDILKCEKGDNKACEIVKNTAELKDCLSEIKDLEKEKKKCKDGDLDACFELETDLSKDVKNKPDDFADLGGFSDDDLKKCKSGNLVICKKNYLNLLKHEQYSSALEFLNPACSKNDNDSCLLIGSYYAQTKQLKKSKTYFVKSCNANLYKGCLGAGLASNSDGDKIKFFEKSCRGQESFGCYFLGDIQFKEKLFTRALSYYDKSCNLDNAEACEKKCITLANLDTSSAFVLDECLKTSCSKGNTNSCEMRTTINNKINNSSDNYARKRRMIDDSIRESEANRALFNGLSKAAQQMGNAISGSNNQENYSPPSYNDQIPTQNTSNRGASVHKGPNNVCNCKGYSGVGGPCYDGPGGAAYSGVGGPAYAGVGGPCYDGVGGAAYSGVGGPAYKGVGGPAYDGVGGAAYDGVGGPAYSGLGGPCYAGVGGPCYSGVGGTGQNCPAVCK